MRGSLFSFCNMCSGIRRGKIPAQNLHLRLRMKSTADNTAAVSRNAGVELAGDVLPLLTVDNILEIECVSGVESDAELEEVAAYCAVGLAEVDECEGVGAVVKMLQEAVSIIAGIADKGGSSRLGILVDSDKLLVGEGLESSVAHVADIAADHKRRCEVAPESEVCKILFVCASGNRNISLTVHTGDEHIDIVEALRTAEGPVIGLAENEILYAAEAVVDIAGGTEDVRAGGADPSVNVLCAPVTCGEENVASGGLESHGHSVVEEVSVVLGLVAVVVLEEVNAPISEGLSVDELIVVASRIACAGERTVAGVHTELESLGVNVISKSLHSARKLLGIGNDASVRSALTERPAVVDNNVVIACGSKTRVHHCICGFLDEVLGNVRTEGVP